MIAKKYRRIYYYPFLPLMESIFQCRTSRGQTLVVNEQNLAIYFRVNCHVINDFLKEMEQEQLIKFIGKQRIFEDFSTQFAMRCYELTPTDSKYCSKLQEHINNYMLWEPYLTDRLGVISEYKDALQEKKLSLAQDKFSTGQKLTREERKLIKKHELNILYQKEYPWAIELMNEINAARPDLFKSKYLAEGKNRESNILCGTLNPENEHVSALEQDLVEREMLLTEYFGVSDFEEFDTNASIYRLSYALANGKPLDHNIDVYEMIWKKMYYNISFSKGIRNTLKILCMPAFMSNGGKSAWNAIVAAKEGKLTKSEAARKTALTYLNNITGNSPRSIMEALASAMKKFIRTDDLLEEEIFIHESNLHLLMIKAFSEIGIKTINVYDGFFFIKNTCNQKLFDTIYDKCTYELLKKLK